MGRLSTKGIAAVACVLAVLASGPVRADPWHHHNGNDALAGFVFGTVFGLIVGSATAQHGHRHHGRRHRGQRHRYHRHRYHCVRAGCFSHRQARRLGLRKPGR